MSLDGRSPDGSAPPASSLHEPVLVDRVTELLAPALAEPDAVLVDATLGVGGHSAALLERCPSARLVGIDRDPEALRLAAERLAPFAGRVTFWHGEYDGIAEALSARAGGAAARAVLMDLGVSSLQIDDPARGFSYAHDAPLDMRMNKGTGVTAEDVVNSYSREALARVFRDYGEERFAGRISSAVVRERQRSTISSSARLTRIVAAAVPAAARRAGHPAKRVFQALRIEVNDELAILDRALPAAVSALAVGGRAAVLAYHSLEDRRVKQLFVAQARPLGPDGAPLPPPGGDPVLRLLTRGAERPDSAEALRNPRAASARLRAAEKLREGTKA